VFGGRFSSSIGHVGIDFGTRSIKLLQVREHGRAVHVIGAAEIDRGSVGNDQELAKRFSAELTGRGFTGRRCVIGLPRSVVRVQSIRLPRMPDAELLQAVTWEASQRFAFDREAMQVDFIRTGADLQSAENREEVLIIAVAHGPLQACLHPVLEAGLRPIAVETDFSALARIYSRHCRRESDRSQVRVVVEVGITGSSVLILRGDQVAFCKTVGIGGERFNRAVMDHLQLDARAAAELRAARIGNAARKADGTSIDPATDRAVFEAVRPLLSELAKEVVLCLRYYGVTFRGHPPDRIILSGGDGLEPRFHELIEQACKIPVAFDDSNDTLSNLVPEIGRILNRSAGIAPNWAVAAGLSARGIQIRRSAEEKSTTAPARRGAAA